MTFFLLEKLNKWIAEVIYFTVHTSIYSNNFFIILISSQNRITTEIQPLNAVLNAMETVIVQGIDQFNLQFICHCKYPRKNTE